MLKVLICFFLVNLNFKLDTTLTNKVSAKKVNKNNALAFQLDKAPDYKESINIFNS